MFKNTLLVGASVLGAVILLAQGGPSQFHATLEPTNEIPAVSGTAAGTFTATLQNNDTELAYEFNYSGLSGAPTQAHIHFGQTFANGAVVYWICGSTANPPQGGTVTICPQAKDGKVTGIIRAANIVAATTQGISAGDFAKILEAIRDGNTYVNIHTVQSPGGEARGQLRPGGGSNDGTDDGDGQGKGNSKGKGKGGD
ncbi:MAG: hypothetical protein JWO19_673 [Bryobacterales bacterium]|nr:hypothetical protein [Bryobacterales bacterium]